MTSKMKNNIDKLFSSPKRLDSLYGVRKLYEDLGSKKKKSLAFMNIVQALKTNKKKQLPKQFVNSSSNSRGLQN